MENDPLVSIIIPSYNHAQFLAEALRSVNNQTYQNIEVIVVNDGSTDQTVELLDQFHTIKVITQENQGLSAARNTGIAQANGTFIALLDSDDCMEHDRIEKQLDVFHRDETIDVVYTAISVINEKGDPLNVIRREAVPVDQFLPLEFFRNLVPSPSTIMAKKLVFNEILFNPTFRIGEDLEWILKAAHQYTFHYLDAPLTKYRRHQHNLSEKLEDLRNVELSILRSYGSKHILGLVEASSIEDKNLLKGKILYIMEEYDLSRKHLARSSDSLADFYQGNCLFEQGMFKEALTLYKISLGKNESNPACLNNYAVCCSKLGNEDEANVAFSKALALKPGYLDPKFKRFTRRELRKDLLPYRH